MMLLQQNTMVSTRGVKFKFSEGEKVLCYEPDSSKAKVLYDSKVLELVVDKDSRGRKVAEYLIHFSGWNSSWDRCVAEEFILPDNPENRKLQKRLAEEAAQKLLQAGKAKRRKVPAILKESINKKLNEKRQRQNEKKEQAESTTTSEDSSSDAEQSSEDDNEAVEDGEGKDDEEQEEEEDEEVEESEDEEEVAAEGTFCLDVPQILKEKLEDDCYFVTRRKKLLRLPCKPSVIEVLEAYVKHYAILLHSRVTAAKPQDAKSSLCPIDIAHTRLDLCKEMVDGLRILFDHTLLELLLYSSERKQHEIVVSSRAPRGNDITANKENSKEETTASQHKDFAGHSSRSRLVSQNGSSSPEDSSPARRGSRSPSERRTLRSADKTSAANSGPVESTEENATERKTSVTSTLERKPAVASSSERKPFVMASSERKPSSASAPERKPSSMPASERKPPPSSGPDRKQPAASSTERKPSSTSTPERRPSSTSAPERKPPSTSATERKPSSAPERRPSSTPASERKQPSSSGPDRKPPSTSAPERKPPFTSAPERKSSVTSLPEQVVKSQPSSESAAANGVAGSLLDPGWHLLPKEEQERAVTSKAPSSVYGAVHFLRLFVKLPDMLSRMGMSEKKLEHLRAHLTRLLEHLAERHEELFPPSAYESAHRVMAELEN